VRISGPAVFSLCVAALGGYATFAAAGWPLKAKLFPLVLGIPLCVLGLLQLVFELRGKGGQEATAEVIPGSGRRVAAVFSWMVVFIVLVLLAGFPVAVPAFVLAYLLAHRAAPIGPALLITAAAWGAFHLLFQRLLHFPFESGLIQDWLAK
jgi:hypothetical protein